MLLFIFSELEKPKTKSLFEDTKYKEGLIVKDEALSLILIQKKAKKKYLASLNTNLIPTYEFLVALMDAIIMLGKFNFHQNFP